MSKRTPDKFTGPNLSDVDAHEDIENFILPAERSETEAHVNEAGRGDANRTKNAFARALEYLGAIPKTTDDSESK